MSYSEAHIREVWASNGKQLFKFDGNGVGTITPRRAGQLRSSDAEWSDIYDGSFLVENLIVESINAIIYKSLSEDNLCNYAYICDYILLVLSKQPRSFFKQIVDETFGFRNKMYEIAGIIETLKIGFGNASSKEFKHYVSLEELRATFYKCSIIFCKTKVKLIFSDSPVIEFENFIGAPLTPDIFVFIVNDGKNSVRLQHNDYLDNELVMYFNYMQNMNCDYTLYAYSSNDFLEMKAI